MAYEEIRLKNELAQEKQVAYTSEKFLNVNLYPNKFDQKILQRLRLSFLTS